MHALIFSEIGQYWSRLIYQQVGKFCDVELRCFKAVLGGIVATSGG